jgi:hypothetical protein
MTTIRISGLQEYLQKNNEEYGRTPANKHI